MAVLLFPKESARFVRSEERGKTFNPSYTDIKELNRIAWRASFEYICIERITANANP